MPIPTSKRVVASEISNMLEALGAHDCGFVDIDHPALDEDRPHILRCFPQTRTLIAIVCRMNREPVKSVNRTVANLEFHHAGDEVDEIARQLVSRLERIGIKAINPSMAFPMELEHFPDRGWIVSHKRVAEAAGLGRMGIHRSLIHPRFGSFVLLGTVLIEAEVDSKSQALDFNPCVECKLCVAACPVGAIKSDGYFDFSSCYTHNYQQFMGGFVNWVEDIADSKSAKDYRKRVSYPETVVRWQSLSYKPNYNAAYCLAVCPAGEEVIGEYLQDKKAHLNQVVRPLQDKQEQIFVVRASDAEDYVRRRFPNKLLRYVKSAGRPTNIRNFLFGMTLSFQRGKAKGTNCLYHFEFSGREQVKVSVRIKQSKLEIIEGHVGTPDLRIKADAVCWIRFINKEVSLLRCLLSGKIRLRGSPLLLKRFGECFPS